MQKSLELQTRKALGCCKQSLVDCSGGYLEDEYTNRNVDSGGPGDAVSEGNKNSTGNWTRGHSHYILSNHLAAFYLCSDSE